MNSQLVPVFSGEIGANTKPTQYALQIPGIGPVRLVENTLTDDAPEPDEQTPIDIPATEGADSADRPIPVQVVPIFSGESGTSGRTTQYALRVPGLGPLRMVENNLLEIEPPEVIEIPILEPEEQSVAPFKAELVPIFSGEIGLTTSPTQYALQVPGVGAIRMVENTLPIVIVYNIRRTLDNRIRRTTSGAIRRTSG